MCVTTLVFVKFELKQ